jgi:hypothetical protein
MPSEWVGVVGTGIGAAIGGVVTVASLVVKGRQDEVAEKRREQREDRVRTEDREWSLRERNLEKRQDLYYELWNAALVVLESVGNARVAIRDAGDDDDSAKTREEARVKATAAIDTFNEIRRRVIVVAINRTVLEEANSFVRWATDHLKENTESTMMDGAQIIERMSAACRRDLGYDFGGGSNMVNPQIDA